jgi:drug/metabolite transporter (DMT)-like permease
MVGLSLIWGSVYVLIKVALSAISPMAIVEDRLVLGSLVVTGVLLLRRTPLGWSRQVILRSVALGVLGTVLPFLLVATAEVHVTSIAAVILAATVPLFTFGFAVSFGDERFSAWQLGALMVGLAGVIELNDPTGSESLFSGGAGLVGEAALLLSSLCFGAANVLYRKVLRHASPASTVGIQLIMAALVLGAWKWSVGGGLEYSGDPRVVGAVLFLGLLGTGVAYPLYFWLIQRVGSTRSSVTTYLVPLVGIPLGALTLGERVGISVGLGAVLILAGALGITIIRPWRPATVQEVG